MRRVVSSIVLLGLALGLFGTVACDPEFGRVSLHQLRATPEAELGAQGIVVPEGGVLVFEAQPRAAEGSRDYVGFERFEMRPSDSRKVEVRRSIVRDVWVVNGVESGSTALQVLIDGDVVDTIPVDVVVGTATQSEEDR
ncbi:hypothetical protein [Paraliomyxa miuraensis]|uniref:hypothetical protein n=1 Tax=Paraliomyxa miuraensis TaxID=376150 RepID=UPI00224FA150|nr:hypothetical protein [Paraliomyxa miuraensis]MCX4239940.1 hypothetical protein [Paraliomyxa miuraensis]